jgi:hypothetical protein
MSQQTSTEAVNEEEAKAREEEECRRKEHETFGEPGDRWDGLG